jgi:transcriptional regulator with XRE-family HTH domain
MTFVFYIFAIIYKIIPFPFTQLNRSIMEIFSICLIKNRQKLNLSQEQAATQIGVGQSTYQEWEKGRSPKLEYLPKLKALFGLSSTDELFEDSSKITPPPVIQHL